MKFSLYALNKQKFINYFNRHISLNFGNLRRILNENPGAQPNHFLCFKFYLVIRKVQEA